MRFFLVLIKDNIEIIIFYHLFVYWFAQNEMVTMRNFNILLILFSCIFANALSQNNSQEEEKIKSLLLREVDALNKTQDIEEYIACFAPSEEIVFGPQRDQLIVGVSALRPFAEQIIASYKKNPNKNSWVFSDWRIRINGNSAFVTCTQTTTTPTGAKILVFKSDYLEKYNGDWKILDHRFYHTAEQK